MALSVSAVLLLAVIVVLLVRRAGLNIMHAIVCMLFGFYLASSNMAPTINDFSNGIADMISSLSF
ncbi:hypothetical protein E1265_35065 [Streptomyces sp. 8K308]|uniref:hypothetical protein n=1 Tax=Streptomyces sp. 8K308 TaxID=2530388 RepID=UPI0010466323|nr:hypothetical protein [Streptomyces sp. 8K308]TDC05957.1 hypothetical protein E1265_35065 [Streptomyces sp. 8K308]